MIKVAIADTHAVIRHGVRSLLETDSELEFAGEAVDCNSTLALARRSEARVLTLEPMMDAIHGIELVSQISRENPLLRILVLTAHSEQIYAVGAFKAGASGFLTKASSRADLREAIRKVASGGVYVSLATADLLAQRLNENAGILPHHRLSLRELEVFVAIAIGQPQSAIAKSLGVSVKTISTHRTRILDKMKMHHNVAVVRYALLHKLIEDDAA
jgi:Response regulator containing a CheY-like receiver domain and an HTH DNA-binding domain